MRRSTTRLVRPFGAWAPSKTLEELKARTPRPKDFKLRDGWTSRNYCYYNPESMAQFKDPQYFKDCLNKIRASAVDHNHFCGFGLRPGSNNGKKVCATSCAFLLLMLAITQWFYGSYLPQNNSRWRKMMNKEWEEAINNSPWDHRTHVWLYCDIYCACLGDITSLGRKKFYIPA